MSTTPCIYDVGNGQKLDIRTLGNNGKKPKYDNIPNRSPIPSSFSWNGCFDYSKSDGGSCTNAAACRTNTNTGQSTVIAKQNEVEFEHHDSVNLLIYRHENLYVSVFLTCRDVEEDVAYGIEEDPTTIKIFVESRCCCPGKCYYSGDSLSGGSIFIIILVVLISVYLIGGVIFLKFARGATGQDMIPNRVMWLNILSYGIDGVRYSIQVIRNRSFSVEYQKV